MPPVLRLPPPARGLVALLALLLLTACTTGGDGRSSGVPRCDRNGDQEQRKAC